MITILCLNCGQEFNDYPSLHRKFCSPSCAMKFKTATRRVDRVCKNCGKDFNTKLSHTNGKNGKRGEFCSNACCSQFHTRPASERFARHVHKTDTCWLWTAATDGKGYGRFDNMAAHRFAYELYIGPIPDKLFVCHKCDNPPCVNPDHLFLGTQKDNMLDCSRKGRTSSGAYKLNRDQVEQIRERYKPGIVTQAQLGQEFGVSKAAISAITRCTRWKPLP
jgi:YHS domain-containing protein